MTQECEVENLETAAGGYPITPYVVGPSGQAGYQTIQSAVDAAISAGGGIVYIQPGTYNENLNVPNGVHLVGAVFMPDYSVGTPVKITGGLTVDSSFLTESSYNNFYNINFSPTSGDVFTFNTNGGYQSVASFFGCVLQVNEGGKAALVTDGFPTVYLTNCIVSSSVTSGDLFALRGAARFGYVFAENTTFEINASSYVVVPSTADVQYTIRNCVWNAMVDVSSGTNSYFLLDAEDTNFQWDGTGGLSPMINFGGTEGAFVCQNGRVINGVGPLTSSTSTDDNSFFDIYSTVFMGPYIAASNCKEKIYTSVFNGGDSPGVIMNSSQSVTLSGCSINSVNDPAISGVGSGTLYLSDVCFLQNTSIANGVNASYLPTKTGALTFGGPQLLSGAGAPTVSAPKGSLYSNTTANSPSTRLYVNIDGSNGWASFTAAG